MLTDAAPLTDARSTATALRCTDPWAVDQRRRRAPRFPMVAWLGRWALAVVLGTLAPAVALTDLGHRRAAVALVVAAAAWEIVLVVTSRRAPLAPIALAVGAVPAGIVAPPSVGWLAASVMLVAVCAAHLAVAGWQRVERGAAPARLLTLALVPLAATQASWLRSNRQTTELVTRPVTLALLLAGGGALAWYRLAPAGAERVASRLTALVKAAAGAIGTVVLLVVALPLLYLPGAVGTLGRSLTRLVSRRSPAGSGWIERSSSLREVRRDSTRPFVTTEPRERRRRVAVATCSVLVLVAAGAVGVRTYRDHRSPVGGKGVLLLNNWRKVPYSELPAFQDAPWADDLQDELDRAFEKAYLPGRYVNWVDGVRRSEPVPTCPCKRLTVWFFGGSAAFGLGQRDEGTIASALVRDAAQHGIALDMKNLGVPGYTLWNDDQKLTSRLALTQDRPDLVIFYDGFNDVVGTVLHTALKGVDRSNPTVLNTQESYDYDATLPSLDPYGGPAAAARLAVDKYVGVKQQIEILARAEGIPVAFVWQPDAFTSRARMADFADISGPTVDQLADAEVGKALDAAPALLPDDVVDLRTVLDGAPRPVFLSAVHTNELGAQLVADALERELRPTFDRLGRPS